MRKDIIEIDGRKSDGRKCKIKMDRNAFEYYPPDMDKDMIPVCNALNAFPGVRTFFCCSGHGAGGDGFYISLGVRNMMSLKRITSVFDIYGVKNLPTGFKRYVLEPDSSFWPLKKTEIGIRISNKWVSGLNNKSRKREFGRIVRRMKKTRI